MATDPYSWAARIGEQGYADKQNAQANQNNVLMQLFQEEAARQRQQTGAALDISSMQQRLAIQQPYDIAAEQRSLENDMALRRFYSENPIPDAVDMNATSAPAPGTVIDNGDGTTTETKPVAGRTLVITRDASGNVISHEMQ